VKNSPTPLEMIGIQDTFGESGFPEELTAKYQLMAKDIVLAVQKVVKRK